MGAPRIEISDLELGELRVYVAHECGGWGPELPGDYHRHELRWDEDNSTLSIDPVFLEPGEEFKLVVPVSGEDEARHVYAARFEAGILVSQRFDFDSSHNTFWLLVPQYPVVRPMEWNQNNIFLYNE